MDRRNDRAAFNPLKERETELKAAIRAQKDERREIGDQLAWIGAFSRQGTLRKLNAQKRALQETQDAASKHASLSTKRKNRADRLRKDARPGIDPRRWFSEDRARKKRLAANAKERFESTQAELESLISTAQEASERCAEYEKDLARAERIDVDLLRQRASALDEQLPVMEFELERLRIRRKAVDAKLAEPRKEWGRLEKQVAALTHDMADAEEFEHRLTLARNSYERAMIHDECEDRFNERSPGKVIANLRREIGGAERAKKKLRERMLDTARKASREIASIVIDGNNLCYEDSRFIGLDAIAPVADALVHSHQVTVVFDASIRSLLGKRDADIRDAFPARVTVHVMASRGKADETVLRSAAESMTYVLSNDRYAEYPEQPAVREQRLIRHEITGGRVLVGDLDIDIRYVNN